MERGDGARLNILNESYRLCDFSQKIVEEIQTTRYILAY